MTVIRCVSLSNVRGKLSIFRASMANGWLEMRLISVINSPSTLLNLDHSAGSCALISALPKTESYRQKKIVV